MGRTEFREARAAFDRLARVVRAADFDAALSLLHESEEAIDLIVVAQAYPGQYAADRIDGLRRLAPLARVIGLLGSWCEGEVRSGRPWPGAIRVYWHQWPVRCRQELGLLNRGLASTWSLPPTAGEEERALALAETPLRIGQGLVVIYSREFAMHDWLAATCRRAGYATVWLRPSQSVRIEGAKALVFDGTECQGEELEELNRIGTTFRPAPILALLNFPRVEDCQRAHSAGASAVISKPVPPEDLLWYLGQSAGRE